VKAVLVFLLVTWCGGASCGSAWIQILAISWKLLVPASILLLLATGLWGRHARRRCW